MNRRQLEHVLRAAARITGDPDVLVLGSQSILGAVLDDRLPLEATVSMAVDVTFFHDPDDTKSDQVDGAIGELSAFHETYGYYAQGVSITTAILPRGWQSRLVVLDSAGAAPGRGHCLDPHDCVVSKLVAGREKDFTFAGVLIRERLVSSGRCDTGIEQSACRSSARRRATPGAVHQLVDRGPGARVALLVDLVQQAGACLLRIRVGGWPRRDRLGEVVPSAAEWVDAAVHLDPKRAARQLRDLPAPTPLGLAPSAAYGASVRRSHHI